MTPGVTLAVLTVGLVLPALAFAVWPLLRRPASAAAPAPDDERAALETEKVAALHALRELELDYQAGHVAPDDYAELRQRDEARAAAVLRRPDALPAAPPPGAVARPPEPVAAITPWTRQPLVLGATGAALLIFGVVLGVLVARQTTSTPADGAPPAAIAEGPAPGPVTDGGGAGPAAAAPAAGEAPVAGGAAPRPLSKEMLAGMLRAAHQSLDAGRYREAIAAYTAILRRDSRNVEAITHLGVILAVAGHQEQALEAFDRALAIDPDYAHALWDKAGVLEARADHAGVVATLERFVRVVPPGPDREQAEARLREARARLASAPSIPRAGAAAPAAPGRPAAARPGAPAGRP